MYSFGNNSLKALETIFPDYQEILKIAIKNCPWDFSLVWGRRSAEWQTMCFRGGTSKVQWPFSNHNSFEVHEHGKWIEPKFGSERKSYLRQIDNLDIRECQGYVHAFDIVPYPQKWSDKELIISLSRWIQGYFASHNIALRLGIDWNGDGKWKDENFFDGGHFEKL